MADFGRLFRLSGKEPGAGEDVAAELESHLQMKVDALIAQGRSPEAARREAEASFGPVRRFEAECRSIDRQHGRELRLRERLATLWQDLRLAARALRRSPGFTVVAVLVLALGIGLNATVFSVLRGVVMEPLGLPSSDRLIRIYSSNPASGWPEFSVSPADFLDFAAESRSFDGLVAWYDTDVAASGDGMAERLPAMAVTEDFLRVAGVRPRLGRGFVAADFDPGAPRVAIISHSAWLTRFGGDPELSGKTWMLDGERREIVGVMPSGFAFPVRESQVWLPLRMPVDPGSQRGAHYLAVAGRLAGSARLEGARAELETLAARLERTYPRTNTGWTVLLRPLHEDVVEDARPTLLLLMTGVGLLLLLACANVANLVLVRSLGRSGEAAVRSALGAGRGRLVWHAASEVLFLVGIGAACSVPVAVLGLDLIHRLAPAGVPRLDSAGLEPASMLFTLGATALVALLVGLAPAARILRADIRSALASGGRTVGPRRGVQRWLVATETAIALALLAVAGVLLRSKQRLEAVDPGFDPGATLVAGLALPQRGYPDGEAIVRFQRRLVEESRRIPGVESAAIIFGLPLSGFGWSGSFTIDSLEVADGVQQSAQVRVVSADYFTVQRIPVVEGRGFMPADRRGGRRVLLVSRSAARRWWPDGTPIGHYLRFGVRPGDDRPEGEVVGVVEDVREHGLDRDPRPITYALADQVAVDEVSILLRTSGAPLTAAPSLRRIVATLDPELPLSGIRTMADVVRDATGPQRFRTWLMGLFALLATALAGLGVYGVISHLVAQRTREMGLRRALGASDARVTGEVVGRGMRDAAAGAVVGLGLGWVITRNLSAMLYQVAPGDPFVLGAAAAGFLGISLLACWIPARRAARADPALALREE